MRRILAILFCFMLTSQASGRTDGFWHIGTDEIKLLVADCSKVLFGLTLSQPSCLLYYHQLSYQLQADNPEPALKTIHKIVAQEFGLRADLRSYPYEGPGYLWVPMSQQGIQVGKRLDMSRFYSLSLVEQAYFLVCACADLKAYDDNKQA